MNIYDAIDDRENTDIESRPDSVDTFVEKQRDRVGYEVSEPLGAECYDRYPKGREDLLVPSAGPILREIAENDRVDSLEDLSEELNLSVSLLEDYAHLHNISLPVSVEKQNSPVVQAPDGNGDTIALNTADLDSDFRVAFHLYVTLHMTVEEIANVCNTDSTAVTRILQSHKIL